MRTDHPLESLERRREKQQAGSGVKAQGRKSILFVKEFELFRIGVIFLPRKWIPCHVTRNGQAMAEITSGEDTAKIIHALERKL